MHNLTFVMRRRGGLVDENALPCLRACRGLCPDPLKPDVVVSEGIPRCPAFINRNPVQEVNPVSHKTALFGSTDWPIAPPIESPLKQACSSIAVTLSPLRTLTTVVTYTPS